MTRCHGWIGWIGVGLDGTLAYYDARRWPEHIGAPIPAMVRRVREWLAQGREVRIVTARVATSGRFAPESSLRDDEAFAAQQRTLIEDWCEEHVGARLLVTASRDYAMRALWDDRVVSVVTNTGELSTCVLDAATQVRLHRPLCEPERADREAIVPAPNEVPLADPPRPELALAVRALCAQVHELIRLCRLTEDLLCQANEENANA